MWTSTESLEEELLRAEHRGHDMENDPPQHGLSRVRRFTCAKCGRALLKGERSVYGSAGDIECDGNPS